MDFLTQKPKDKTFLCHPVSGRFIGIPWNRIPLTLTWSPFGEQLFPDLYVVDERGHSASAQSSVPFVCT